MHPSGISRALLGAALVALPHVVSGQSYPAKPIRTIMTVAGGAEPAVRLLSQKLTDSLGQPVILEMNSAAGGAVGAAAVARASPDGYTLAFATTSAMVMRPFLTRNTPYEPLKDFAPIGKVGEAISAVLAYPGLPVRTIPEMIEYARRNPGKISYGTSGIGTTHHLSGELIQQLAGVNMVHVPYKGSVQAIQDLVTGRLQVVFSTLGATLPQVEAGKLRLLAINSNRRYARTPDVPTVLEVLPGYDRPPGWMAYFGPAALPQPVVKRLFADIAKGMQTAEVGALFEKLGSVVELSESPEQFAAEFRRNVEQASRLVKASGIEPE